MPEYLESMINKRLTLIEELTNVHVLFWSLRGSLDVGIYRDNSDIDVIFVYSCADKNKKALHDIVGHGLDLWGWIIDDVLDTIEFCSTNGLDDLIKNKCALTAEHARGSLSYYFGLYVCLGNCFSKSRDGFLEKTANTWLELYNPNIVIAELYCHMLPIYSKISSKGIVSGSQCVYGLWYALMIKGICDRMLPGENKIRDLLVRYGNDDLTNRFYEIHSIYKRGAGKNAQFFDDEVINSFIISSFKFAERKLGDFSLPNYNKKTILELIK